MSERFSMRRKMYKLALLILLSILLTVAVAVGYSIGPGSRFNGYVINMFSRNYETDKENSLL